MFVDRKTQMCDAVREHQKREGIAGLDGPPRSAPHPIREDQQAGHRQSQQRYPDRKGKLKRGKAHGADRWIVQIEETRSSFVGHMHG